MTSETPLRTGVLFKKGSGTGPFGRRNWKPRYFVLTPRKLSYYTYEDGELKGEVDLTGCTDQSIEVMPADSMKTGSSASTIWRIAINAADRRLIVAAGTESEMNEWVEQLLIAFHVNSGQPMPQRRSTLHALPIATAPGAIAHTHMDSDFSRNSITDFQNFAVARRSVGGAVRASLGAHPGHEFRLSDEYERQKQAEQQRMEEQRQLAAMEAERLREEELLQAHLRSQAEERRKEKERREEQEHGQPQTEEKEQERRDSMLEEQRRLKREQHERERQEAERQLRQLELEEEEKRHENEIQSQFEQEHQVVEIHRPAHQVVEIQRPAPSSPARSPVANRPPRSPVRSPVGTPASPSYRSPVIDEAKKDAMMRQQAEHTKRREATIRDQQKQPEQDIGPHHDNHAHLNHASPSSPAKMSSQASVEF